MPTVCSFKSTEKDIVITKELISAHWLDADIRRFQTCAGLLVTCLVTNLQDAVLFNYVEVAYSVAEPEP
jgi:hypothetical protein